MKNKECQIIVSIESPGNLIMEVMADLIISFPYEQKEQISKALLNNEIKFSAKKLLEITSL